MVSIRKHCVSVFACESAPDLWKSALNSIQNDWWHQWRHLGEMIGKYSENKGGAMTQINAAPFSLVLGIYTTPITTIFLPSPPFSSHTTVLCERKMLLSTFYRWRTKATWFAQGDIGRAANLWQRRSLSLPKPKLNVPFLSTYIYSFYNLHRAFSGSCWNFPQIHASNSLAGLCILPATISLMFLEEEQHGPPWLPLHHHFSIVASFNNSLKM